jgi:DNA polymerase-4
MRAGRARRQIIHVDMDAFFASVEQLDDPRLRGKPVIVGGPSKRSVVSAASYEARPFGVHSAMPLAEAMRRCPHAIVRPVRHKRYAEVSHQVFKIFERFTPLVEGLSSDEAFLDVTASRALFGDGEAIARQIKSSIKRELGLTASAGVAPCKFAAKIASDLDKPDGLLVVPDDVAGFLAPLPVERMWGVGPVATKRVRDAGLNTIGDLAAADSRLLVTLLGSWGEQVHHLANGIDDREVISGVPAKSIGAEDTFDKDLNSQEDLERHLLSQSCRIAGRLFTKGIYGRVVVVKVKLADFRLHTSRMTLPEPVADADSIYAAAKQLLARLHLCGKSVRLTGVAVAGLSTGPAQRTLFEDEQKKRRERIQEVTARIQGRFGDQLLTRASLLDRR